MPTPDVPAVIQITQVNSTDSLGKLVPTLLIQFKVGQHGPFTLQIPSSQFTADEARRRMQVIADTVNQITSPA